MRPEEDKRTHDLTIEEIKALACFKGISDERAREVIAALKTLSYIAYELYRREKTFEKASP